MPETTTQPVYSTEVPALLQSHFDHLRASAISPDVMKERGYRSVSSPDELEAAGFFAKQRRPGIIIPIWGVDGKRVYNLLRPTEPRRSKSKRADGSVKESVLKYEHPKGVGLHLDVHPRCLKHLKNPNVPLHIVEGVKKGDAMVSAGAECVVVISGVWGWKGINADGGKTVLVDFDLIALNGRDVYVSMDSDLWSNKNIGKAYKGLKGFLEYKTSKVHVIKYADAADGKKVGADDYLAAGHSLVDIYALETTETPAGAKQIVRQKIEDFFTEDREGYFAVKSNGEVSTQSPLANFVAKIIEDIVTYDGQTTTRIYKIRGMMLKDLAVLPLIEVPAEQLKSLSWIDKFWGSGPTVYSGIGRGIEEQFVTAIKMRSNNIVKKTVYTSAGWWLINGKWEFLTSAGALDNPGIDVKLDESLKNYSIPTPAPGADMKAAVQTSLEFMNIGSVKDAQKFLIPLWGEMYLAPVCQLLNPNFTGWIYGESGCFKSTTAGLALSHFGPFDDVSLPSNFHDTENRIEQLLYWAKDLPIVVDDWAPGQSIADAQRLEHKAEHLNRAQGNHQGRGRMKYGGQEQPVYVPRGLQIVTAEQLPRGHSNTARILSMKIKKGDIDIEKLTAAQKTREQMPIAMAGYIRWLKGEWAREGWGEKNCPLKDRVEQYRNGAYAALKDSQHPRIPQMVAYIATGIHLGTWYAQGVGALTPELGEKTRNDGWDYLIALAKEQNERITKQNAFRRLLTVLNNLIDTGVAKTNAKSDINEPFTEPGRKFIGWEDGEFYYLKADTVYGMVCDFCQRTGEIFTVTADAVWDGLKEQGFVVTKPSEKGTTTAEHISCYGRSVRVLKLKKSALLEPEE